MLGSYKLSPWSFEVKLGWRVKGSIWSDFGSVDSCLGAP